MSMKCGLCQNERSLRSSHCIPGALIHLCRDVGFEPIHILDGTAFTTSYEARAPFLCFECEAKFDKLGESTVIAQCLRRPGAFPFREKLRGLRPVSCLEGSRVYMSAQLPSSDVDALKYFAASVFWRSSAMQWKIAKRRYTKDNLGYKYREQFRKYLLGESGYPSKAAMVMIVSDDDDLAPFVLWPSVTRGEGCHRHVFYIPGIEFNLFVGNVLPEEIRRLRLASGDNLIIFLELFRKTELYQALKSATQSVQPKGKLRSWLESINSQSNY